MKRLWRWLCRWLHIRRLRREMRWNTNRATVCEGIGLPGTAAMHRRIARRYQMMIEHMEQESDHEQQ